jgi:nucleotide-binding universal stress UspA family protein
MFEKIVVAVDGDPQKASNVVTAAEQVAQAGHSEVLVAHVRELEGAALLAGAPRPGVLPPALPNDGSPEAEAFVDLSVEKLRSAGISARGVVRPGAGSTAKELLRIAESFDATLIVVGNDGQRVTDLLLGGVAHRISRDADCSVLLVR